MVVDYQAHWTPRAYFDSLLGRKSFPRAERRGDGYYVEFRQTEARYFPPKFFDLDVQLHDMECHGIDVMVTSPTHADVAGVPFDEALATVTMLNEETARIQREWPDKVVGLAVLPMEYPEAAISSVRTAVDELDLRGFCLFSNIGGRRLVSEETMPVYDEIARAGVPIFLHPTNSMLADRGMGDAIERGLSWMFDTSAAALSLVYGGVLDAHPELEVVHPHAGGVIPYVLERMEFMEANTFSDADASGRELPLREYLRERFWVDTVNDTPGALDLASRTYGLGHVIYGSDYPYFPREKTLGVIEGRQDGRRILEGAGPRTLRLPLPDQSPASSSADGLPGR